LAPEMRIVRTNRTKIPPLSNGRQRQAIACARPPGTSTPPKGKYESRIRHVGSIGESNAHGRRKSQRAIYARSHEMCLAREAREASLGEARFIRTVAPASLETLYRCPRCRAESIDWKAGCRAITTVSFSRTRLTKLGTGESLNGRLDGLAARASPAGSLRARQI
jgi:hypothetical protein